MTESWRRPTRALISRSALEHNVALLARVMAPAGLCSVVKADGYGHGAALVAPVLAPSVAYFAVATIDEGLELRAVGVTTPILLFAEIARDDLDTAFDAQLTVSVGSLVGARDVVEVAQSRRTQQRVHLKVDTGMHRLGINPSDALAAAQALSSCAFVDFEALYTHFSVADSDDDEHVAYTRGQRALFASVLDELRRHGVCPARTHLANSAGALGDEQARGSLVRLGLSVYGYLPANWLGAALDEVGAALRPVLSVHSRVNALRRVGPGERPGYGRRRATTRDTTLATVPIGYADGYPRRFLDAGAEVLVRGRRYPLAGTVSMDQLIVDLGDDPVEIGDEVVLLGTSGGERISANDWARWNETIAYEVLCGLGARVPRELVE